MKREFKRDEVGVGVFPSRHISRDVCDGNFLAILRLPAVRLRMAPANRLHVHSFVRSLRLLRSPLQYF